MASAFGCPSTIANPSTNPPADLCQYCDGNGVRRHDRPTLRHVEPLWDLSSPAHTHRSGVTRTRPTVRRLNAATTDLQTGARKSVGSIYLGWMTPSASSADKSAVLSRRPAIMAAT